MTGGEIVVSGDAGEEAGAGMRRGLVAIGGRTGAGAGLRMLAGTVIALGGIGAEAGHGQQARQPRLRCGARRRCPSYTFAARFQPPALRLQLRRGARARPAGRRRAAARRRWARWSGDRTELSRGEILIFDDAEGKRVSLSMNERAADAVDAMVADADALGIEVRTLDSGARVVDCGAQARGGLQAGLGFAAACMGGLGRIDPVPVTVGERAWPGVGVAADDPAAACLAAQYAGWKLEHDDFFAMASGPGRALARAEDLFEELAWREQADRAVLCLETRQEPPAGDRRQGRGPLRGRAVAR